jgi:hypothetical protein
MAILYISSGLCVLKEAEEHHRAHRAELRDLKEKIQELDAQLGNPQSPGAGPLSESVAIN